MSDWEDKLNTLLSDPDAMAQVMSMAQNLSQQLSASDADAPRTETPPEDAQHTSAAPPDLSALLGGLDPALLQKLPPLLAQLNRPESGETAALLHALRPFLKPERQQKVERAAQLARLLHLGKVFLLGQEGGENV